MLLEKKQVLLSPKNRQDLADIADELLASGEKTSLTDRLVKAVRKGAAFHHAGLKPQHRKLVENGFKDNIIKCVSATPTLAAGVNLPARRVVILSLSRYQGCIVLVKRR
ncbi:MAG: helicase-related protein [Candidatus Heimdallarchaeota archaeon]